MPFDGNPARQPVFTPPSSGACRNKAFDVMMVRAA